MSKALADCGSNKSASVALAHPHPHPHPPTLTPTPTPTPTLTPTRNQVNFIELATKSMVMPGTFVAPAQISLLDLEYVGVKAPMFSFTRLAGADPVLGVEMASTGEVATFGEDKYDAILTSMMASGFKQPKSTVFVCIGPLHCKLEFLQSARELLELGLTLYCSQGTYDFYKGHGLAVKLLHKPSAQKEPNVASYLAEGKLDMVINVRDTHADDGSITDGYTIRRKAVDFSVCLLTDIKLSILIIEAMFRKKEPVIKAWDQFGMVA